MLLESVLITSISHLILCKKNNKQITNQGGFLTDEILLFYKSRWIFRIFVWFNNILVIYSLWFCSRHTIFFFAATHTSLSNVLIE